MKQYKWAVVAVLGLFLGACAHQPGGDSLDDMASSENSGFSSEQSVGDGGLSEENVANAELGEEMAPMEGTSEFPSFEGSSEEMSSSDQASSEAVNQDLTQFENALDGTPSSTEEGAASQETAASSMESAPVADTFPGSYPEEATQPVVQEASSAPAPVATQPRVVKAKKAVRLPSAPTQPMERRGALLNRFYISRTGDTPASLATLIYGSADKAGDLAAWNGDAWRPGKVVYYVSPGQPADGEMRSYYEEAGLASTEHEVKKGDTLASISEMVYGTSDQWKEIGVLNGISNPDEMKVGAKLNLYPAELKAAPQAAALDQQIESLENQISRLEGDIRKETASTTEPAKVPSEAGIVGSQPMLSDVPSKDLAAVGRERQKARSMAHATMEDDEADMASAEVGAFFKQHSTLMVILVALLAGFAVFFVLKKVRDAGEI